MSSEAQKRASMKYNKKNTVQFCLRLNKETDKEIISCLERSTNKNGYIKRLIMADIKHNKIT